MFIIAFIYLLGMLVQVIIMYLVLIQMQARTYIQLNQYFLTIITYKCMHILCGLFGTSRKFTIFVDIMLINNITESQQISTNISYGITNIIHIKCFKQDH